MERQRLMALQLGKSKGCAATRTHNRTIGRLSRQKWLQQDRYYVLNMSVNRASTILGVASWIFKGLCYDINP